MTFVVEVSLVVWLIGCERWFFSPRVLVFAEADVKKGD